MALPNTFKQLAYIESTGTQYINSGISASQQANLKIDTELSYSVVPSDAGFIASRQANNDTRRYFAYGYQGYWYFGVGVLYNSNVSIVADQKYHLVSQIKSGDSYLNVDDVRCVTYTGSVTTTGSKTLTIFASNYYDGVKFYSQGKLYYLTIYDATTNAVLRDYVPAMRLSDRVVGLYDLANNTFYTNAGTGTFLYGYSIEAIANPVGGGTITGTGIYANGESVVLNALANNGYVFDKWSLGYTKLDYIESSGTQYIYTGLNTSTKRKLELGFSINSTSRANVYGVGGTNNNTDLVYSLRAGSSSYSTFQVYQRAPSGVVNTNVPVDTEKHDLVIDNKNASVIFDSVTYTGYQNTGTNPYKEYVFAYNRIGTIDNTYSLVGRVYYAKYYEDGVLVRDFIPVKRNSDDEIGLLDMVGMEFYPNVGTGTFTYGEELGQIEIEDNPLTFVASDNVSLVANFKLNYQITLTYDQDLGTASYEWTSPTEITLSAVANQDAQFIGWYVNSVQISNSTTYVYSVLSDVTIEARFEPIYQVTDSVSGSGAISYTRGTDQNDVTFTVIPSANWHFVKYVVGVDEYTSTPLSLHLTADISITAVFEENDKFTVSTRTNIDYASVYVSDSPVYVGTVVTLYARPMPDYYFVRWEDGNSENPREITVTEDVLMVAIYQRMADDPNVQQYRCYIKDQLSLTDPPKAFLRVDQFTVKTDLMTNANSTIKCLDIATNVNNGDVLVLYDATGQTLYQGVIKSIADQTITCSQMQSFYKGTWIYNVHPSTYLEEEIAWLLDQYSLGKIYQSTYTDQLVAQRLGGITVQYEGNTSANLPTDLDKDGNEQYTTKDFEKFIYSLYEDYGIIFDFEINFSGANYVTIKMPDYSVLKVGNNMYAIKDMSPITTIEETNRLIIFNRNKTYRTTYVATANGIVENPSTTANRFNITNTKVVFSDDATADLVSANLPDNMYNHKLTFTLVIKNFIYQFGDFNLGGSLDVWHGDDYYNTVLTGYEIKKASRQNITEVGFTCGLVRTALTKKLTLGVVL